MENVIREGNSREIPAYIRIADDIRSRIESGEIRRGERLPGERVCCAKYQVARGTLKAAFSILQKEGLLSQSRGSGTFVNEERKEGPSPEEKAVCLVDELARTGLREEEILRLARKAAHAGEGEGRGCGYAEAGNL